MANVERIPKTGYNSFHKYHYATESDLVESGRKLLVEQGLVLFNDVREYEITGDLATVKIDFTLCDIETGESVTTCIVGQGVDKGDKAFYKAYAGATKYYLMKTFLIPTGDDPESDPATDQRAYGAQQNNFPNRNQQQAPPQQQQSQQPQNDVRNSRPVTEKQLELINQRIDEISLMINQDKDAIIQSLRERVGEFDTLNQMNMLQASRSIENLTKWKTSYQNKMQ